MNRRASRARRRKLDRKTVSADKRDANVAKRKRWAKKTAGPVRKFLRRFGYYTTCALVSVFLAWKSAENGASIGDQISIGLVLFVIGMLPYYARSRKCPICGTKMCKAERRKSDRASTGGRRISTSGARFQRFVFFHRCLGCDIELLNKEIDIWKYLEVEESPVPGSWKYVETKEGPKIHGDIRRFVSDHLDEEEYPKIEKSHDKLTITTRGERMELIFCGILLGFIVLMIFSLLNVDLPVWIPMVTGAYGCLVSAYNRTVIEVNSECISIRDGSHLPCPTLRRTFKVDDVSQVFIRQLETHHHEHGTIDLTFRISAVMQDGFGQWLLDVDTVDVAETIETKIEQFLTIDDVRVHNPPRMKMQTKRFFLPVVLALVFVTLLGVARFLNGAG